MGCPGYCAVVAGTHLTPLMSLAVRYPAMHDAEHALYLVTGYLFFLPVMGSEPIRWRVPAAGRLLMLLAVMPIDTVTGVVLTLAPAGFFPRRPATVHQRITHAGLAVPRGRGVDDGAHLAA